MVDDLKTKNFTLFSKVKMNDTPIQVFRCVFLHRVWFLGISFDLDVNAYYQVVVQIEIFLSSLCSMYSVESFWIVYSLIALAHA